MVRTEEHSGPLVPPIEALEEYFRRGGASILEAAFAHSFFLSPEAVRGRSPLFPNAARYSRKHYPNLSKGDAAVWQGRDVKLDDNSRAQLAWSKYSGRPIARRSGYGVRHVWGHPWDPVAFTAGWNLCYMPFWAGMLTEAQHPYPALEEAVRQAAWDLYFREDPVCEPPEYVADPGLDLRAVLGDQPLLLLVAEQ